MYKRGLSTVVTTLIIILLVLVTVGIVWIIKEDNTSKEDFNESVVIRSFSSTTVSAGSQIDVTLDVLMINNETFYAMEEYIPEGWVVIEDGGGATANLNRLAWVVFDMINLLPNTTLIYTVQAPSSTGNYDFDGIYQFEGFADTVTTKGQTTVTVT